METIQKIALPDALRMMDDKDQPFSIQFVSYNSEKKTGGEIIDLPAVKKCGAKFNLKDNDMIAVRPVNNRNHPYPVHIHLITMFNGLKVFI